jgi:tRNA pseudouridine38-40 synthase
VAHFEVNEQIDAFRLRASLNGLLPPAIAVRAVEQAPPGFHARYDARSRRYRYYLSTLPTALERHLRWLVRPAPDFDAMNEAAGLLVGRHDFDAFCRTQSATTNRVCEVASAGWRREDTPGHACFEIVADRFLHGMVRAVVGTLVDVGQGRRARDEIQAILQSRDRRQAGAAAPAHGLVLEEVRYDVPFADSSFD